MKIQKTFELKDSFGYTYSIYELNEVEQAKFKKRYMLDRTISQDALDDTPHDEFINNAKRSSRFGFGMGLFDTIEEAGNFYLTQSVKFFARDQFCAAGEDENGLIGVVSEKHGIKVINPWMDPSGRFSLSDEEAVEVYGAELINEFKNKVLTELQ